MVNHRIWDDTLLSKQSMKTIKLLFEEIYPLIKNNVNIFLQEMEKGNTLEI